MQTRCTPGQRAMVIDGSLPGNFGKVVRVRQLITHPLIWILCGGPPWSFDGELVGPDGSPCYAVGDHCLLPLEEVPAPAVP